MMQQDDMQFAYTYMNANMHTPLAVYKGINAHFLLESASLESGKGRYSIIVRNINFGLQKYSQDSKMLYTFETYIKDSPKNRANSFLLSNLAEYTELPPFLMQLKDSISSIQNNHARKGSDVDFDFLELAKIFRNALPKIPKILKSLPLPLGGLGFVGYEFFSECENIMFQQESLYDAPEALLVFPQECIVFDHFYDSMYIVVNTLNNDAQAKLETLRKEIMSLQNTQTNELLEGHEVLESKIVYEDSKEWYEANVARIKDEIYKGTFLQCVLSRAVAIKSNMNPLHFYETLRHNNPSPYMYYLDFGAFSVIGASPEVMLQCKDNIQTLRPIAGTRKRGANAQEDRILEQELLNDEKENAEHLMLVDLGRNDIGRNAKIGSVKINAFKVIERYSSVIHIVSEVCGEIMEGRDNNDCFKACFPAGTVSGAPKIEAIKKLAQYETHKRSIYSGAILYFTRNGDLDSAITLRSAVVQNGIYYLQAGAGIVIDSDPTNEYIETCNKMKALHDILIKPN